MQAADVTSQDSRARHLTDASRPCGNLSTKLDAQVVTLSSRITITASSHTAASVRETRRK